MRGHPTDVRRPWHPARTLCWTLETCHNGATPVVIPQPGDARDIPQGLHAGRARHPTPMRHCRSSRNLETPLTSHTNLILNTN